jgi:diphthamide synthase (EF-2-diphthine--ammonia ligase)
MSRPRFLFLTGLVLLAALSRVVCRTNDAYLHESFVGKNIDADFVASLPTDVDLCDENPEFHSFAFAGPIFKEPVRVQVGEKVYRPLEETHPGASSTLCPSPVARRTKGFWFCDLLPA